MSIPRIRGRAGTADEGPDKGKWFYEVTLWDLSGENLLFGPYQFGPFESEDEACDYGRNKVKELSEIIEEEMTGEKSGKYLDLKNGAILRPWVNQ